jgi:hypothetical protein
MIPLLIESSVGPIKKRFHMFSKSIRKGVIALSCVLALGASASAMATAHVVVPASAILIQTYSGITPTLYYTGSGCSSGHLNLDPTVDGAEREKLLWATVLSAKASGLKMNFDYDIAGDVCYIRYFAVEPS